MDYTNKRIDIYFWGYMNKLDPEDIDNVNFRFCS